MNKEEPNTKLYFNNKIARVIFEDDPERKVYWLEISDHQHNHRLIHYIHFHHYLYHLHFLQLPIEEWVKENNITYPFDEYDAVLFKMRWV